MNLCRNKIAKIASEQLPFLSEHAVAMQIAIDAKVGDDLKGKRSML